MVSQITSKFNCFKSFQDNNRISFLKMGREQKISYLTAMLFRTLHKGVGVSRDLARNGAAVLVGAKLSGIFGTRIVTKILINVSVNAGCYPDAADVHPRMDLINDSQTFEQLLNQILIAPIDTLMYSTMGAWAFAHTFSPMIQRPLKTREDRLIQQIIRAQNRAPEEAASRKPSTLAKKLDFLIEYFMPIVFDATRIALLLRAIRGVGSATIPGYFYTEWERIMTKLYIYLTFQLSQIVLEMTPGEDPVATNTLVALFGVGILLYASQAWCNFDHDLQVEAEEAEPSTSQDTPSIEMSEV